jgi:hypothetical protein
MTVHLLWIINKSGQLVYNHFFAGKEVIGEGARSGDSQMTMAAVLYGLHGMSRQIAPVPADVLECDGISLIEGSEHNMLIFETPTGVKFVIVADTQTKDASYLFNQLYQAYADYVLKNPFYGLDSAGIGQPIRIGYFSTLVEEVVASFNGDKK